MTGGLNHGTTGGGKTLGRFLGVPAPHTPALHRRASDDEHRIVGGRVGRQRCRSEASPSIRFLCGLARSKHARWRRENFGERFPWRQWE
jgi:hypothetical protein